MTSTATTADDHLVQRLTTIVYTFLGPGRWVHPMDPIAALDELGSWTRDDHQWVEEQRINWGNWESLFDDVLLSWGELPHTVKRETAAATADPLKAIANARTRLQQERAGVLDASLRTSLTTAHGELQAALMQPAVLSAAWTDLLRAVRKGSHEREQTALALLSVLAELQDRPWRPFAQRIWQVLGDDNNAIAALEAEIAGDPPPPYETPARASVPAGRRLELAAAMLKLPARAQVAVVWLAYHQAHVPQFVVELGPAVTLFEGAWITSVVQHRETTSEQNRGQIPAEVAAHAKEFLEAWEMDGEHPNLRHVLVRVALGETQPARALAEARGTTEALLRLAAFYNRGREIWEDTGSFVVFLDGKPDWRSSGMSVDLGGVVPIDRIYDKTATRLAELAPKISPHLPVQDPLVAEALELLRWLTEARRSWRPGTLVLSVRILEKVAGWATYGDWSRFARERLALHWALDRIGDEIAETGRIAVREIDRSGGMTPTDPVRRAAYLEAIGPRGILDTGDAERLVTMPAVLRELDWLAGWQPRGSGGALRVAQLRDRIVDGAKAARWLKRLMSQFNAMLARSARTRNSLVHGGPVAELTVLNVAHFVDELASDALSHALVAQLEGRSVADVFDARQADLEARRTKMEPGWDPISVLFA